MTAPTVSPQDREEAVRTLLEFASDLERLNCGVQLPNQARRLASAIQIVLQGER
jgi:hypothetical protein